MRQSCLEKLCEYEVKPIGHADKERVSFWVYDSGERVVYIAFLNKRLSEAPGNLGIPIPITGSYPIDDPQIKPAAEIVFKHRIMLYLEKNGYQIEF